MKILDIQPEYNRSYDMPKELWDEVRLLKIHNSRKSIGEILDMLPTQVKKLVKIGRKKKTIPNGSKFKVVFIDEVAPHKVKGE